MITSSENNSSLKQLTTKLPPIPEEFREIAPYDDELFHQKLEELVREPGFENAVKYIMPKVDYDAFIENLLSVETQDDFQVKVMGPFLEFLASTTSKGVFLSGKENLNGAKAHTFITNHRDIVLDASFLNLCFIREKLPITQVAIGNNLLIYDWITKLVKINKSFIVKRDIRPTQALKAAIELSKYMHWAIDVRNQSIWIAQREGRAKDSNDKTQESLVKMMALGGEGSIKQNLLELYITPVAISYEYDPNDYLKVKEFILKQRNPEFKKSQHDDLLSMETGILGQKGRIYFNIGSCINSDLEKFEGESRNDVVHYVCKLIDNEIHSGYHLFPCNYIAYDKLKNTSKFWDKYTQADVEQFEEYVHSRLVKVDIPDLTLLEKEYMMKMMLTMYANPLYNFLQVPKKSKI